MLKGLSAEPAWLRIRVRQESLIYMPHDCNSFLQPTRLIRRGISHRSMRVRYDDVPTLPITGTYTIFIDPNSSNTASATLTLYDVPADTSQSTTINASAVSLSTTVPGQNTFITALTKSSLIQSERIWKRERASHEPVELFPCHYVSRCKGVG
jgi:hypothetical protein